MGKLWEKFCRWLFGAAFVAVIVAGVVLTLPKYRQAKGLSRERDLLRRRIAEKQREIDAYREKKHRFTSDREFVENLARENRRVYPNELVFVFEN